MKKLTFLIVVSYMLFTMPVRSQDNKIDTIKSTSTSMQQFKEDLKASVDDLDSAKNLNEWVSASNHLGLIATKFSDQWAANYYACYSRTVLSFMEKDAKKKDAYLDEADALLEKAISDYKVEYDELVVLKALIANARIAVQPMLRYKKYGDIFNENIEKAKSMNPDNPRIYYMKGNSVFYTPKMFGGGAKNALPLFEKAADLFKSESKDDIYKPYWGAVQNEQMIAKCKEDIK